MTTRQRLSMASLVLIMTLAPGAGRALVSAQSESGVLIAELQTASSADSGAELLALANQSSAVVDLDGWKVQYRSATGTSWSTKATLTGSIEPSGRLLIATSKLAIVDSHQTMVDGLAQAGGHVQVINKLGQVQDLLGWGTALASESQAAPAPDKDQSLFRKTQDGKYIDSDNNAQDFELEVMPVIEKPVTSPSDPAVSTNPSPSPQPRLNSGLSNPVISELLPNPASPQTDDHDEYVELYNPNNGVFLLDGYKLKSGKNLTNNVSLKGQSIPAKGYLVLTSATTALSLSNAGGRVHMLDPEDHTIATTDDYTTAAAGMVWAFSDGGWQWSSSPTPGSANVVSEPDTEDASQEGGASTKAATTTKSTTSKTASDKQNSNSSMNKSNPRVHTVIIALVAAAAVAYAIYEYRQDIGNLIYKLRKYRENRRGHRSVS